MKSYRRARRSTPRVVRWRPRIPFWIQRLLILSIILGSGFFGARYTYRIIRRARAQYTRMQHEMVSTRTQLRMLQNQHALSALKQSSMLSPTNDWTAVQRQVEDGVVQVFAHMARFDWLRPYRTPDEVTSVGSGFFINGQGELLTNYHLVAQARAVMIRLPRLGQEQFKVDIVGVCPDRDIALLRLTDDERSKILKKLGSIAFLSLGDSDGVVRTQEVMALGFPLGRLSLKSTIGNISGWERVGSQSFVQLTSPINPGNSGGPAVDRLGRVVGINSAVVPGAQNTGFFIPITEIKHVLHDLYKTPLLRKPVLGGDFSIYLDATREYLGNPEGGGWYVTYVYDGTLLDKAGVCKGDVLYEINGHKLDKYGDVEVSWAPDSKVSVLDLLNRYSIGDELSLVLYRRGERKELQLKFDDGFVLPIRKMYPDWEQVDYEVCGGMVLMPLSLNTIQALLENDNSLASTLMRYLRPDKQYDEALVVTHVFPNSPAKEAKLVDVGLVIDTINDMPVHTLEHARQAIAAHSGDEHMTITTQYDRRFIVMKYADIKEKESQLAALHGYKITPFMQAMTNG